MSQPGPITVAQLPQSVALVSSPNTFTKTQTITPAVNTNALNITMPESFTASGVLVSGPQDGSGAGNPISVYLYGTGGGVDIKGWTPNAAGGLTMGGIPLAVHQYGTPPLGGTAARIDNCGAGISLILASTENSNNAPTTWGNGDAITLNGYNGYTTFAAAATVTGTNTVTDATNAPFLPNCVGKPIIVGAVKTKIATYVSASQVTTTDAVTNAAGVTYSLPLKANVGQVARLTLDVTPTGNGGSGMLRFINTQTGVSGRSADPWSFENATDNGAAALRVVQAAGTSGASALLVNSNGNTGNIASFQVAGTTKVSVDLNGVLQVASNAVISNSSGFGLRVNNSGTSNGIYINNTSSGGPLLIQQAGTTVWQVDTNGSTTMNGNIIVGSAANGMRIGTATSQKLAFYNSTPIIQPTGTPAASTDLASVISLANSLRTNLLALGLVA